MPPWALWIVCFGLLTMRALMAAAESALYGTSDMRAKALSKDFPRAGARLLRHKMDRETTAGAIRIGMVLSGFLAAGIGAMVPPRLLDLSRFGDEPYLSPLTAVAGALFVGLLAAVTDVLARSLASTAPERWALRLSWVVSSLTFILYPLMRLMVGLLNLLIRPFKLRARFESPPPPLEELEEMLAARAASTEGVDKGAPQLIRSIFELSDKHARDVMVPRTDVVAVDISTGSAEVLRLLTEESHSRIPVYKDDIDHIVGILHARDLIPLLQHPELIVLSDVVRPAAFTPWMKPVGDLLREMQKKRIHMSMVVDEYGGFMGVVTLEDILREIVGDIADEFEEEEKPVERQADGSWLVDAGLEVEGFTLAFGVALPEGDYETLGGFLSSLSGSIPEVGERFAFNGLQFVVHSKEGARIDRVRVTRPAGKSRDLPAAAQATPPSPPTRG